MRSISAINEIVMENNVIVIHHVIVIHQSQGCRMLHYLI